MSSISDFDFDDFVGYHAGPPHALHIPIHGGVGVAVGVYGVGPDGKSGHRFIGGGTIACVVTANATGRKLLLSNDHVFYPDGIGRNASGSQRNLIVPDNLAPQLAKDKKTGAIGIIPSGRSLDVDPSNLLGVALLGLNTRQSSTQPLMDAALAIPTAATSHYVNGIGIPTGHVAPRVGMKVIKSGASLGISKGTIIQIGDITLANAKAKPVTDKANPFTTVKDGILIAGMPPVPGDSGSIIMEEGTNKVVALFCCGFNATTSMAVPAIRIAQSFNISFVGDNNITQPMQESARPSATAAAVTPKTSPLRSPAAPAAAPASISPTSLLSSNQIIQGIDNNTLLLGLGGLVLLLVVSK